MAQPRDNLILFDGVCNLCTASVQFIIRHDKQAKFRFVTLQSELGREISRGCLLDPDDLQTFLVLTEDRILTRSDAALAVVRHFAGPWRWLLVFRFMPKGLRDWLYTFVARRRYRWFGRRDVCMTPAPEVRARFLP